mgnify:CR=1 FL=1
MKMKGCIQNVRRVPDQIQFAGLCAASQTPLLSPPSKNMTADLPTLDREAILKWIDENVPVNEFKSRRVLLIVPDSTRTAPLPILFPALRKLLGPVTQKLDLLVALGTHPPMPEAKIRSMLGIANDDPCNDVGLFNHEWDNPDALATIGTLTESDTREISNGVLAQEVPVQINKRVLDYDVALIVGPASMAFIDDDEVEVFHAGCLDGVVSLKMARRRAAGGGFRRHAALASKKRA